MITEKTKWLWSLTLAQRMLFFSELSLGMTVVMRAICRSSEAGTLERVNALNEAHHAVSGYLVRASSNAENESWLAMSIKNVLSSDDPILRQQLEQSWLAAESRVLNEMK